MLFVMICCGNFPKICSVNLNFLSENVSRQQLPPVSGPVLSCAQAKDRFSRILDDMDREAIRRCTDRSSCKMLCSRIVGASLRRPIAAARTPRRLRAVAAS